MALALGLSACGGAAAPAGTGEAVAPSGEVHQVAQRTVTRVGDLSVGLSGVRGEDGALTAQLSISDTSTGEANFESVSGAAGDSFDVYGRRLAIVEVAPGETGDGVVRFTLE